MPTRRAASAAARPAADDTHAADDTEDGRDGSSHEVRGDDDEPRLDEKFGRGGLVRRRRGRHEHAEKHDVAAGEEFRQEGDWTADDAGGPQVWDSEGHLVEGSTPGEPESSRSESSRSESGQSDRAGPARATIPGPTADRARRRWTRSATVATASARPRRSTTGPSRSGTPSRRGRTPRRSSRPTTRSTTRPSRTCGSPTSTRPSEPASVPSTDSGSAVQVGSGNESADAPSARSTAWRVGRIDVPSVRLPGIPRLRA